MLVVRPHDRSQGELVLLPPLRELVPDDHILVQIDKVLDLSWLLAEVEHLYCPDNGRPAIAPEVVMRLMLAGLLEGIIHDRKLLSRAQTDLAWRWFIGYRVDERLPNHSSLTRIRQRWGVEVFERVFERTVQQCIEAGLVDASAVHVDSTLVRANASPNSFVQEHLSQVAEANTLEEPSEENAVSGEEACATEEGVRVAAVDESSRAVAMGTQESMGDVTLGTVPKKKSKDPNRAIRRSKTDGDCRFGRSSKRKGYEPSYKAHAVVENGHGVVVGSGLTAGNVHEGETLLGLVDAAESRTGQKVKQACADTAYGMAWNFGELERSSREAIIPAQAPSRHKGGFPAFRFSYDPHTDRVRCPRKRSLHRHRAVETGVEYRSRSSDCKRCPDAGRCLPGSRGSRTILIVHDHAALVRARRRQWRGEIRNHPLARRRWCCAERTFGESKGCHGMGHAARRGLREVWVQVQLTFAVQNLRRLLAHTRSRAALQGSGSAARRLLSWLLALSDAIRLQFPTKRVMERTTA
jgi:transposase